MQRGCPRARALGCRCCLSVAQQRAIDIATQAQLIAFCDDDDFIIEGGRQSREIHRLTGARREILLSLQHEAAQIVDLDGPLRAIVGARVSFLLHLRGEPIDAGHELGHLLVHVVKDILRDTLCRRGSAIGSRGNGAIGCEHGSGN